MLAGVSLLVGLLSLHIMKIGCHLLISSDQSCTAVEGVLLIPNLG